MNQKYLNIILALLIYLPTCAFVPLYLYLVLIAVCIYLNLGFLQRFASNLFKGKIIDKNFAFLLLFAFITFIYRIVDLENWESIKDIYSFGYLFPFTYIIARSIKGREVILKYILYFILIEVAVSVIQYAFGVNTFYTSLRRYRVFESYDMLYFTRTFGLGANSSLLSFKYIFGLILLGVIKLPQRTSIVFELVLLIGSIITFGRIALIVVFFFLLLRLIDSIFIKKNFNLVNQIPFILIVLFFAVNPTWTYNQFTRNDTVVSLGRIDIDELEENDIQDGETIAFTHEFGLNKIDMSGRNEIWNTFSTYISENPQFGNKGKKVMFGRYHAHNSFLELLASYGIYMFLFMLFIIFRNMSINNYVLIFTLGLLSFGQYLVFWGVSIFDILFYYLIFFYKKDENK